MGKNRKMNIDDRCFWSPLISLFGIVLMTGCGYLTEASDEQKLEMPFTQLNSPSSTMQAYLSRARNHRRAYLGDDKIEYPTCVYSTHPTIKDLTRAQKERLRSFAQGVINEYVSYLYGRFSFRVRHVTLVDMMKDGQPCTDTYYGNTDTLRLKPIRLRMDPTTGYAGYGGSVRITLNQHVATAPDFMVDWSPGPGQGYYESTSAVVRHELGHCWGLHHEVNLPSAVYGVDGQGQSRLRIYGDDINGITHMWRAYNDPDYKQDCPEGYKRVADQGPGSGAHFPGDWGCLPDINSMNSVRIRNKETDKCLTYSQNAEGVSLKQADCDSGSSNQQWDVLKYDNYGRHIICSSPSQPLLCVRAENFSNAPNTKMELGLVHEAYSPWYLIPNEDGTWMLQQPETVQVMYASSTSTTDEVIKQRKPLGDWKERWIVAQAPGNTNMRIYQKDEPSVPIPTSESGAATSHLTLSEDQDDIPVDSCEVAVRVDHPRQEDLRIEFLNYHGGVNLRTTLHEYGETLRDAYNVADCRLQTALGTWAIAVYDRGSGAGGVLNGWSLTINKAGP